MNKSYLLMLIALILSSNNAFAGYDKLTEKNYEKFENEKAVLVYGVNWGRQWGCSGLENAQLEGLIFTRIDVQSEKLDGESLVLKSPSALFVDDVSTTAAVIVNPGEYALTGFDIKVAKDRGRVGHLIADSTTLFKNGKSSGGTFTVNAGEIVYIGDFGLDCENEDKPLPWRYYIETKDFARFVETIKKEHPFLADKEVFYRLFETDTLGIKES